MHQMNLKATMKKDCEKEQYTPNKMDEICFGHIYLCEFGIGFEGENNGIAKVVVLNVMEDCCWVLRISEIDNQIPSEPFLKMVKDEDVVYYAEKTCEENAILLLESIQKVNKKRIISSSMGKVTLVFLRKIGRQIASFLPIEGTAGEETLISDLRQIIEPAILKCDDSIYREEQVQQFLKNIHMPTDDVLLQEALISAIDIGKNINWNKLLPELRKKFPKLSRQKIRKALNQVFEEWLKCYPTLTQKHIQIYFINFVNVFVKAIVVQR